MFVSTANGLPQIFCVVFGILLVIQPKYYEFSESVNRNYYGNTSATLLRFRDFEPRSASQPISVRAAAIGNGLDGAGIREARGFQFHADKEDVKIDIEFVVPFVRIPIKRSMELTTTTFRNLVQLNTGSLLLSGVFVAVGAAVAALFKVFGTTSFMPSYGYQKTSRVTEGVSQLMEPFSFVTHDTSSNVSKTNRMVTNVNELLQNVESKFRDNDIEMRSCVQKSICLYVKGAAVDVRMGKATGTAKIIDGFTSLDYVHQFLSGTAVQKALDAAKSSRSCAEVFVSCKWMQPANKMMLQLMRYLNHLNSG